MVFPFLRRPWSMPMTFISVPVWLRHWPLPFLRSSHSQLTVQRLSWAPGAGRMPTDPRDSTQCWALSSQVAWVRPASSSPALSLRLQHITSSLSTNSGFQVGKRRGHSRPWLRGYNLSNPSKRVDQVGARNFPLHFRCGIRPWAFCCQPKHLNNGYFRTLVLPDDILSSSTSVVNLPTPFVNSKCPFYFPSRRSLSISLLNRS